MTFPFCCLISLILINRTYIKHMFEVNRLQDALEEAELSSLASKLEHVIATISDD